MTAPAPPPTDTKTEPTPREEEVARVEQAVAQVKGVVVESDTQWEEAGRLLLDVAALRTQVEEHHDPIIAAARETLRIATAAKKRVDDPLREAEEGLKKAMSAYVDARDHRARVEQLGREPEGEREVRCIVLGSAAAVQHKVAARGADGFDPKSRRSGSSGSSSSSR